MPNNSTRADPRSHTGGAAPASKTVNSKAAAASSPIAASFPDLAPRRFPRRQTDHDQRRREGSRTRPDRTGWAEQRQRLVDQHPEATGDHHQRRDAPPPDAAVSLINIHAIRTRVVRDQQADDDREDTEHHDETELVDDRAGLGPALVLGGWQRRPASPTRTSPSGERPRCQPTVTSHHAPPHPGDRDPSPGPTPGDTLRVRPMAHPPPGTLVSGWTGAPGIRRCGAPGRRLIGCRTSLLSPTVAARPLLLRCRRDRTTR